MLFSSFNNKKKINKRIRTKMFGAIISFMLTSFSVASCSVISSAQNRLKMDTEKDSDSIYNLNKTIAGTHIINNGNKFELNLSYSSQISKEDIEDMFYFHSSRSDSSQDLIFEWQDVYDPNIPGTYNVKILDSSKILSKDLSIIVDENDTMEPSISFDLDTTLNGNKIFKRNDIYNLNINLDSNITKDQIESLILSNDNLDNSVNKIISWNKEFTTKNTGDFVLSAYSIDSSNNMSKHIILNVKVIDIQKPTFKITKDPVLLKMYRVVKHDNSYDVILPIPTTKTTIRDVENAVYAEDDSEIIVTTRWEKDKINAVPQDFSKSGRYLFSKVARDSYNNVTVIQVNVIVEDGSINSSNVSVLLDGFINEDANFETFKKNNYSLKLKKHSLVTAEMIENKIQILDSFHIFKDSYYRWDKKLNTKVSGNYVLNLVVTDILLNKHVLKVNVEVLEGVKPVFTPPDIITLDNKHNIIKTNENSYILTLNEVDTITAKDIENHFSSRLITDNLDNYNEDFVVSHEWNHPFIVHTIGEYILKTIAIDSSNNKIKILLHVFVEKDMIPPQINIDNSQIWFPLLKSITSNEYTMKLTHNYQLTNFDIENAVSVIDNIDSNLPIAFIWDKPFNTKVPGNYLLTIKATDMSNNDMKLTIKIVVDNDETPPIIVVSQNFMHGIECSIHDDDSYDINVLSSLEINKEYIESLVSAHDEMYKNIPLFFSWDKPFNIKIESNYKLTIKVSDMHNNSSTVILNIHVNHDPAFPRFSWNDKMVSNPLITSTKIADNKYFVNVKHSHELDSNYFEHIILINDDKNVTTTFTWLNQLNMQLTGEYELKIVATDQYGNTSIIILNITVIKDETPPTISLSTSFRLGDAIKKITDNEYELTLHRKYPITSNNIEDLIVTTDEFDSNVFLSYWWDVELNTRISQDYTLFAIAQDNDGNYDFLQLVVTISKDETPPTLELKNQFISNFITNSFMNNGRFDKNGDFVITMEHGAIINWNQFSNIATSNDNIDGSLPVDYHWDRLLNTKISGNYILTLSAIDESGNSAMIRVIVNVKKDFFEPTFNVMSHFTKNQKISSIIQSANNLYTLNLIGPKNIYSFDLEHLISATDNFEGQAPLIYSWDKTFNCNVPGRYVLTATTSDSDGNVSSIQLVINVRDDLIAPVINLNQNFINRFQAISQLHKSNLDEYSIVLEHNCDVSSVDFENIAYAHDNVDDSVLIEYSWDRPLDTRKSGNYLLTLTSIDTSQNKSKIIIHVLVKKDFIKPDFHVSGLIPNTNYIFKHNEKYVYTISFKDARNLKESNLKSIITATDNIEGNLEVDFSWDKELNVNVPGTYTLFATTSDTDDNIVNIKVLIVIEPHAPPKITLKKDFINKFHVLNHHHNTYSLTLEYNQVINLDDFIDIANAADNELPLPVSYEWDVLLNTRFPGNYKLTIGAIDLLGNHSLLKVNITVLNITLMSMNTGINLDVNFEKLSMGHRENLVNIHEYNYYAGTTFEPNFFRNSISAHNNHYANLPIIFKWLTPFHSNTLGTYILNVEAYDSIWKVGKNMNIKINIIPDNTPPVFVFHNELNTPLEYMNQAKKSNDHYEFIAINKLKITEEDFTKYITAYDPLRDDYQCNLHFIWNKKLNTNISGDYLLQVIASDGHNNDSIIYINIHVLKNTTPPVWQKINHDSYYDLFVYNHYYAMIKYHQNRASLSFAEFSEYLKNHLLAINDLGQSIPFELETTDLIIDRAHEGKYIVNAFAIDRDGNKSTITIQIIIVKDRVLPVIEINETGLPNGVVIENENENKNNYFINLKPWSTDMTTQDVESIISATDNIDGQINPLLEWNKILDTRHFGTYILTAKAIDSSQNETIVTITINVLEDIVFPVIEFDTFHLFMEDQYIFKERNDKHNTDYHVSLNLKSGLTIERILKAINIWDNFDDGKFLNKHAHWGWKWKFDDSKPGDYIFYISLRDSSNNWTSKQLLVTIKDDIYKPEITFLKNELLSNQTKIITNRWGYEIFADVNGSITKKEIQSLFLAKDNLSDNVSIIFNWSKEFDVNSIGIYVLNAIAIDGSGNESKKIRLKVHVLPSDTLEYEFGTISPKELDITNDSVLASSIDLSWIYYKILNSDNYFRLSKIKRNLFSKKDIILKPEDSNGSLEIIIKKRIHIFCMANSFAPEEIYNVFKDAIVHNGDEIMADAFRGQSLPRGFYLPSKIHEIKKNAFRDAELDGDLIIKGDVWIFGENAFYDLNLHYNDIIFTNTATAGLIYPTVFYFTSPYLVHRVRGLVMANTDLKWLILMSDSFSNVEVDDFIIRCLSGGELERVFWKVQFTNLLIDSDVKIIKIDAFVTCKFYSKLTLPENVIIKISSFVDCTFPLGFKIPATAFLEKHAFVAPVIPPGTHWSLDVPAPGSEVVKD